MNFLLSFPDSDGVDDNKNEHDKALQPINVSRQ